MKTKKYNYEPTSNVFDPDYFGYNPAHYSHKHDYPIEQVWNTDTALAQLIEPRLQAFKELEKHGHPAEFKDMREWNNTIQKIIDAFELMKYVRTTSDIKNKETIERGLDLFRKPFRNLWD